MSCSLVPRGDRHRGRNVIPLITIKWEGKFLEVDQALFGFNILKLCVMCLVVTVGYIMLHHVWFIMRTFINVSNLNVVLVLFFLFI